MEKTLITVIGVAALALGATAKPKPEKWPLETNILDNVLVSQLDCGGWAKNKDKSKPFPASKREKLIAAKGDSDSATIDNNATTSEIRYLLRYHAAKQDSESLAAARKGIQWLLDAQLPNGGWPQFPHRKEGYWTEITFNDYAMSNVLKLMHEASRGEGDFAAIDSDMRARCKTAFDKGLDCVLKCQIRVNGKPTIWCQQHDRNTLAPTGGRKYELASFCSQESGELVLFLMTLENPSQELKDSIAGAVEWFRANQLPDGKWARFYDLEECKPFFCDRDGIPRRSIDEISKERRKGYSWFNAKGAQVIKKYDKLNNPKKKKK